MKTKKATMVLIIVLLLCAAPAASADDRLVILNPGDEIQREFYLQDTFDFFPLGPIESYFVVAAGAAQDLKIELTADPDLKFGESVVFGFLTAGFSSGTGLISVFERGETPGSAEADIHLHSSFGYVIVSALIISKDNGVPTPIPCTISFLLSTDDHDHDDDDHDDDDHDDDHDDHDHDDDHDH